MSAPALPGERIVYFAYGSNLHPGWLARRVPSARALGKAVLPDHGLAFRKRGRDGSAKSDAAHQPGAVLPGAVYEMDHEHLGLLGAAEGGYARLEVTVETSRGPQTAFAYFARKEHHVRHLVPWDWYVGLILTGARLHGLAESHTEWLAGIQTLEDPDRERAAPARSLIASSGG